MLISPQKNYVSANKPVNFQGVPKMFKKSLMVLPVETVEKFIDNYPSPYLITGYFPKDILKFLKKKSNSIIELGENIRLFNKAFSNQASLITSFEPTVIDKVKTIDLVDYTATALLQKAKKNSSLIGYVDYKIKYFLSPKEMNEKLNNPGFTQIMKKVGAIPEDGSVSVEFAGKGTYKDCFKVRFLDKNNEDIAHAKAFVIGHNPHLGETCNNILKKRMQDYITSTDYKQFEKEITDKILSKTGKNDELAQKAIASIKSFYDGDYKSIYYFNGASVFRLFDDINGIFAEANAAFKVRKDLGKKITKSNMITPYIFDLKNQYGLLEFADSKLPPIQYLYDFEQHGAVKIDNRAENFINGRIVDYGCIFRNCEKDQNKYYD